MAEIAAVLFDLDGTLVDTADANFAAYSAALAEAGVTVDRAGFDRAAHARHWKQFLPDLLAGAEIAPEAVARRKQALYPQMMARTHVNAPVLALAMTVRRSCKCALVTTASPRSVEAVLHHHGLAALFDAIVTGDDVAEPKPAPDAYLLSAQRLGVAPASCLAIEDSDIGAESARQAGMAVLRIESARLSD